MHKNVILLNLFIYFDFKKVLYQIFDFQMTQNSVSW